MSDPIEDRVRRIEALVGEAAAVAHRFHTRIVTAAHLLFVVAGTEDGRQAIEHLGGSHRRIRSFLESAFNSMAQPSNAIGGTEMDETIHRVVHSLVETARLNGRAPKLTDLLREMTFLGEACMMTRQALITGGLIETMPHRSDRADDGSAVLPDEFIISDAEDDMNPFGMSDADPNLFGEKAPEQGVQAAPATPSQEPDEHMKAVLSATRDLSQMAAGGGLDEVIGMEAEIVQIIDTISKKKKPNLLISGEPGVGKTALAEGLAAYLLTDAAPSHLRARPVLEVALPDIVAGSRFRGDFEARMRALVTMAKQRNAILFLDEVHLMIGAGSVSGRGGMDASNILKPALARGEITVIGATTPQEMRELRRDGALMRRFGMMALKEPTEEKVRRILDEAVGGYVMHHRILVEDDVLDLVVSLCARYLPAQRFPDKAFDVIDQACVLAVRRNADRVEADDVRRAVERNGSVRLSGPDAPARARLANLETALTGKVFGQPDAVTALARCARVAMLGLNQGGTAGAYLFNGPSGVGKTEMAYAFAEAMGYPLVRIDMSEFMERHSIARLIGAPPGYVGFDQEGLLIEAADKHTDFVLLLDEAEKAHPDVYDILLQILDYGVVRSGDGRAVSYSRAHVILSANIGAAAAEKTAMGFGRTTDAEAEAKEAVGKMFRKEMLARIPNRIQFNATTRSVDVEIARKALNAATRRYADSGFEVAFDEALIDWILDQPQGDGVGGRGVQDMILREIHDPVANAFLADPARRKLHVGLREGVLHIA